MLITNHYLNIFMCFICAYGLWAISNQMKFIKEIKLRIQKYFGKTNDHNVSKKIIRNIFHYVIGVPICKAGSNL